MPHAIRPGHVSLVPSGAVVRYRGRESRGAASGALAGRRPCP
ncbi:hypothetical protein [Streptomyces sp. DSM 41634]|nr:hypothetical protein [Streptomyces sp. DSM 41633]